MRLLKDGGRRTAFVVLAFLATAFLVRLYYMRYHPVMVPDYDGAEYIILGKGGFSGQFFSTIFIPPGFPFLISLALPFFKDPQMAGMVVSALFGTGMCVPVYLLCVETIGKEEAILAASMTALFGQLIVSSTWVMAEMPYAFFLYLGLYLSAVFYRRGDLRSASAMGAVFGAGYLMRPESLLFFIGVSALLVVLTYKVKERKKVLLGLALAWAVMAVFCVPYMVYLRNALGHWSISGKVMYNLADKPANEGAGTVDYIASNIGGLWDKYVHNLPGLKGLILNTYGVPMVLLSAAGAALCLIKGRVGRLGFLLTALIVGYVLLLPLIFVDQRITAPYYPALFIWAAAAIAFVDGKAALFPGLGPVRRYYPVAVIFVVVFAAVNITGLDSQLNSPGFRADMAFIRARYLGTGEWVRQNTLPGEKVISKELLLVFYSGRDYIILPDCTPRELYALAVEKGARLVILDGSCVRKKKALGPLLDPWVIGHATPVEGFTPVYMDPGTDVVIYEVGGVP